MPAPSGTVSRECPLPDDHADVVRPAPSASTAPHGRVVAAALSADPPRRPRTTAGAVSGLVVGCRVVSPRGGRPPRWRTAAASSGRRRRSVPAASSVAAEAAARRRRPGCARPRGILVGSCSISRSGHQVTPDASAAVPAGRSPGTSAPPSTAVSSLGRRARRPSPGSRLGHRDRRPPARRRPRRGRYRRHLHRRPGPGRGAAAGPAGLVIVTAAGGPADRLRRGGPTPAGPAAGRAANRPPGSCTSPGRPPSPPPGSPPDAGAARRPHGPPPRSWVPGRGRGLGRRRAPPRTGLDGSRTTIGGVSSVTILVYGRLSGAVGHPADPAGSQCRDRPARRTRPRPARSDPSSRRPANRCPRGRCR